MKRYKTKEKSLYVFLIKNYVIFTLVMAALLLVLNLAKEWTQERIMRLPRKDEVIGGLSLLKAGEYEKLSMEKMLMTSGFFEILDDEGNVIFSEQDMETGTYEIEIVGKYAVRVTAEEHKGGFYIGE